MRSFNDILTEIKSNYIADEVVRTRYGITDNAATFDGTFSVFSIESIWAGVIALAIFTVEVLFTAHLDEVNRRENAMRIGTVDWWRRACKSFQYGHDLVYNVDTNVFEYNEIDEATQLVKYAEVREGQGAGLLILVNGSDENGNPEPLPAGDVRLSFEAYLKKIKIAGMPLVWGTYNPDKVRITLSVKYNPLLITSEGVIISETGTTVEDELKLYFRNLAYGSGSANKTAIIDAAQKALGVIDVYATGESWLEVSTDAIPEFIPVTSQDVISYGGSFALHELIITYHV